MAVTNFFLKNTYFSFIRVQHVLSYQMIKVPCYQVTTIKNAEVLTFSRTSVNLFKHHSSVRPIKYLFYSRTLLPTRNLQIVEQTLQPLQSVIYTFHQQIIKRISITSPLYIVRLNISFSFLNVPSFLYLCPSHATLIMLDKHYFKIISLFLSLSISLLNYANLVIGTLADIFNRFCKCLFLILSTLYN